MQTSNTKRVKNINEYTKEKKNKNKRRLKKKILRTSLKLLTFSFMAFIIIGNICGQVLISKLNYEVYYLKKELKEEEIRLGELKEEVHINMSIKEIEQRAKEELNMDYPKKEQIRYIVVDN